jgi:hypothetical protein
MAILVSREALNSRRLRRVVLNFARFGLLAVVTMPLIAAVDLIIIGGLVGHGVSLVSQLASWTLLSAPPVLIFGFAAAVPVIVLVEITRPNRALGVLLSVVVGTIVFGVLASAPSTQALSVFERTALESLPLWALFGWVVALPDGAPNQATEQ